MKKNGLGTVMEILLIVAISASVGIAWNRTLLTSAWRGEVARPAEAAAPAANAVTEPMPLGLMQVKELVDAKQAVLLDARSRTSFAEGHLQGAFNLPLEEAAKNPSRPLKVQVPAEASIITYCNGFSCHDSMELAKILVKAGYPNVYVYEGGFPEWRDAGYPVAKGGA
ncbi:sulfurtransferase [Geomonas limicola]|uniref:Sulfurtransferase n=1 Tax=Geomonas limicola TaxID=2740186 RepID=A0A6V8NC38_9BACT|nr:rhodanese-like domain-containing protein [Geomonas limicola]GFO69357.1 sulfurtransferase [Geomonas limicola]